MRVAVAMLVASAVIAAGSSPAGADVIMPGPPIYNIKLSANQQKSRLVAARQAVTGLFDFSDSGRPSYLDDAYRAASRVGVHGVERVADVKLVGERAYVLAVAQKMVAPQVMGQVYAYFQCEFDDEGRLVKVEVL